MDDITTLVKPVFASIGRFYQAVVAAGIPTGALNRENADTVVRNLLHTSWSDNNADIIRTWNLGGDGWGDLIKDVRAYGQRVNTFRRTAAADAKTADREAKKQAKADARG